MKLLKYVVSVVCMGIGAAIVYAFSAVLYDTVVQAPNYWPLAIPLGFVIFGGVGVIALGVVIARSASKKRTP